MRIVENIFNINILIQDLLILFFPYKTKKFRISKTSNNIYTVKKTIKFL